MPSLPTTLPHGAQPARRVRRALGCLRLAAAMLVAGAAAVPVHAQTALADQPLFTTTNVPGNLVLALSVEYPTAITAADRGAYSTSKTYLGYFGPRKCYTYQFNDGLNGSYFAPDGRSDSDFACSGKWSGNFLNWATMQAIDPFRWALTGGYRSVDTSDTTILEKAYAGSRQGTPASNFPHKSLTAGTSSATPFAESIHMRVLRCGTRMLFSTTTAIADEDNCPTSVTAWTGDVVSTLPSTTYSVEVRVKVCVDDGDGDNSGSGSGGDRDDRVESNCTRYGDNYKPEGLIQRYASKIRYSAFGYLNDGSSQRDGGVMRARIKYVGPKKPVPGSTPVTNTLAEWSASTGVFATNPDPADAAASSEAGSVVSSSGVINYLNQFGLSSQFYKQFDPVSELYYAATRYLRNLGNVPEYSDLSNAGASTLASRTTMKDGFPVITDWDDPIERIYASCQRNFVLGIGDTNSNQDKNLPGNSSYTTNEPALPAALTADPLDVVAATNKVGVLEGIGSSIGAANDYNGRNNSAYIAGMAYLFNTTDIRSDLPGRQSISTYWLDVLEGGSLKPGPAGRNQFYLAAKYGGFKAPEGFSFNTRTAPLDQSLWSTNGETIGGLGARPDNFFDAGDADKMVAGLESAFASISVNLSPFTTSFATSLPQVAVSGNSSFSSQYNASNWTGEITASSLSFETTGNPVLDPKWNFSEILAAQLSGRGWDTNRRVVTWNGAAARGVPFRATGPDSLAGTAALALLDTNSDNDDSARFLNYLRGDRANESGSNGSGNSTRYRTRAALLGDIVGSRANPVGAPSFPFSDATNPGYAAFRTTWAERRTVVYFGSNDGMVHAVNGALETVPRSATQPLEGDVARGTEMFAYVPSALFQGPSGTPRIDGLASLGKRSFVHHYMVNATPNVYDIDLARTVGSTSTEPNWRSVLIGGLGKGGRSYYAIDVTDPQGMASGGEGTVASKVLWEFSDPALGFTYGDPVVVKTIKYGWVVVFPSGYNNADGQGYFIFVNPRTGALLEKVSTGTGTTALRAGLAHANGFVVDATDGTADAIYAGDLLGNLWRLDVRATSGNYPAPIKLAVLADASGNAQPVTSRPSIEVHPSTRKRFVMVGTGRLLDGTDIVSTREQTFYSIADGANAQFNTTPTTPLTFPYSRAVLENNSNALVDVSFDPTTQAGWFEDLGIDPARAATSDAPANAANAWRITSDSATFSGSVAFAATVPSGDPCNPSGTSRIFGRDYAAGLTTVRQRVDNALVGTLFVPMADNVTDVRYLSVGGKAELFVGTDAGKMERIDINPPRGLGLRRLNWRELQVIE